MFEGPKLNYLPPTPFGEGVEVKIVDTQLQGNPMAPFSMSKIVVEPGCWSPVDQHDVKECWIIAAGEGVLVYNDKDEHPIKTSDVLYYDSQQSHKVFNKGPLELVIFSLWW